MSYKPTVYEQIVTDYLSGKKLDYDNYKNELAARGWKDKRYFDAYVKDMEYIKGVMDKIDNGEMNLRQAADVVKNNHPTEKKDVLYFSLTDEEKKLVLEAEDKGSFKYELEKGENIKYDGYDREITLAPANNLPHNTDAFVIFSGHPGSAEPAIEAWFEDLNRTGKPKKMVFLGLYDNQGNTDFSNTNLKYNTGSEVEMYVRYCRDAGIPEEVIKECLVTPKDTSTEENTALLAEIRNKYFDKDKDVNFAMFGYPAYQKRIASEFAFQFQKMENEGKVAPTNFIMPVVKTEKNANYRYLSYDNLDGIAQDIIVGNCLAHPYRVSAGGRFDSKLGAYPEKLKSLLPISLVYSYPNVANELAGTDMKVGTMMKLLRAIQHKAYAWENAKRVDRTMQYNNLHLRRRLAKKGLLTIDMLQHRKKFSAIKVSKHYKKSLSKMTPEQKEAEAAKMVLGKNVHHKNIEAWVEFNKRQNESQK
ncbi:MAG: hypothetical protein IJ677_03225 [Alphaproteobacteria bacterium]|nr:hypothetical protein [Alphaproteobacteria bacterium]